MKLLVASYVAVVIMLLLAGCAEKEEKLPAEVIKEKQQPSGPLKIITITASQFEFEPNNITVSYNDNILLTVTSVDVGHGFALPDFGINKKVPAGESIELRFTADKRGEFRFFNSVYSGSGWKNMTGTFIVQ